MKSITKFFFYYTFIAINGLAVISVFFLEAPYNLLYGLVLIPSVAFFWLKLTDPTGASETSWSGRLVIAIAILTSIFIIGFYLKTDANTKAIQLEADLAKERNKSATEIASISGELALLRQELEDKDKEPVEDNDPQEVIDLLNSIDPTASPSASPTPSIELGKVRLKSTQPTDVYQENNKNSKVLGVLEQNTVYKYFEIKDGWYYVQLTEGRHGWVEFDKVYVQN